MRGASTASRRGGRGRAGRAGAAGPGHYPRRWPGSQRSRRREDPCSPAPGRVSCGPRRSIAIRRTRSLQGSGSQAGARLHRAVGRTGVVGEADRARAVDVGLLVVLDRVHVRCAFDRLRGGSGCTQIAPASGTYRWHPGVWDDSVSCGLEVFGWLRALTPGSVMTRVPLGIASRATRKVPVVLDSSENFERP